MSKFKTPEELDVYLEAIAGKIQNLEDRHAEEDGNEDEEISEYDRWFYGLAKKSKDKAGIDEKTGGSERDEKPDV